MCTTVLLDVFQIVGPATLKYIWHNFIRTFVAYVWWTAGLVSLIRAVRLNITLCCPLHVHAARLLVVFTWLNK